MALIQEDPMLLPQRNWSSILSEMIAYDSNPPKTGNNRARAKKIFRLWQNWASLFLSASPQDCCQDTENSKLSIHSSFTERKIILTNVLWRHQTFPPPPNPFAKLRQEQRPLKICWQLIKEAVWGYISANIPKGLISTLLSIAGMKCKEESGC